MNSNKTISGYTTTYQCIERHYPFKECIESLLGFCDEVVVVDAGSTDGTIEEVEKLSKQYKQIRFSVEYVDFTHPRWAIHMDGLLKSKARKLCTGDYCWQTDTDEIVPDYDYKKIRTLPDAIGEAMKEIPVIFLPMVEFWGSFKRIRADFFSWKPRFSRNDPRITHGIPKEYCSVDTSGHPYPRPFDSDSCNYMWCDTRTSVPMALPIALRTQDPMSPDYEKSFYEALEILPCVHHVSWLDLKRKIEHYREFWPKFHASMYNLEDPDTAERNVMFDKPWRQVTDQDIKLKAEEIFCLGPRTFHHKMNPHQIGKTIPFTKAVASSIKRWAAQAGLEIRN